MRYSGGRQESVLASASVCQYLWICHSEVLYVVFSVLFCTRCSPSLANSFFEAKIQVCLLDEVFSDSSGQTVLHTPVDAHTALSIVLLSLYASISTTGLGDSGLGVADSGLLIFLFPGLSTGFGQINEGGLKQGMERAFPATVQLKTIYRIIDCLIPDQNRGSSHYSN